jgi:8-amino-7-oxononanoate synthase
MENTLQNKGFAIKAILSPTVKEGQERMRICLHGFNMKNEVDDLIELLSRFSNSCM